MTRQSNESAASGVRGRTRKAILSAAARLLADGKTPSVVDVAEAAEVSRRTVYMYFPTIEQLIVDATLQSVAATTIDVALAEMDRETDVERRVELMARAVQRLSAATEQQGRTLMRLAAEPTHPDNATSSASRSLPPRGFRRVEWIERALAPLRSVLDATRFERLVSSLAMVVGWEALLVQRDIRALNATEAEELSAWTARALVRATLADLSRPRSSVKRR